MHKSNCENHCRCKEIRKCYDKIYHKSNSIYNDGMARPKEAKDYVSEAIESLDYFSYYMDKSAKLDEKIDDILNYNSCLRYSKENSCKCRKMREKALKHYSRYEREVYEAMELLEKIYCKLDRAERYGKEADELWEKYEECTGVEDCSK